MTLSLAQAELIGIVLHSALFGLYLNLFYQSIPCSVNGRFQPYNRVLWTSNVLLFIFILSHWVVQIIRSQRAFIDTEGQPGPDPASLYYEFPADYMNLLKEALYVAQTFIGDFAMVYRLWVVYDRNYLPIVLPVMIIIAFIVSSVNVIIQLSHTSLGQDIFASAVGRWAIAVFTTSVCTNIITSGLIAYRVWTIQQQVKVLTLVNGSRLKYMHIAQVIVESAALYTAMTIIVLIGYSTKETWQFIFLDMLSPIIGISFTLISVRANRTKSSAQGGFASHEIPNSNVNAVHVRVVPDIRHEAIGLDTIDGHAAQRASKFTDSGDDECTVGGDKGGHFRRSSARE